MKIKLPTFLTAKVSLYHIFVFVVVLGLLYSLSAVAQNLSTKQMNSLQAEGIDCDSVTGGCFFLLLGAMDSDNEVVPLALDSDGNLQVDVLSGGGTPEDVTLADGTADPSPVAPVGAFLMGWNGTAWDRLDLDANDNLMVSLGTALDGAIDEVTIQINGTTPQLDDTDKMAVSLYGSDAASGDTALVVDSTSDTLKVSLWQPGVSSNGVEFTTNPADDRSNTAVDGLHTLAFLFGLDNEGNWDRVRVVDDENGTDPGDGTDDGMLASAAFGYALNTSSTWDRVKMSAITGFTSFPSAACTVVTVSGATAACGTANHGTVGSTYYVQSNARAVCRAEEDATSPAVVVGTDMPVESPGIYPWMVVSTSTDTLCCDTASGDAVIHVCEVTFP